MNTITVRAVEQAQDPAFAGIAPLFDAMHVEMAGQGMTLARAPNGAHIWADSIAPGLERFSRLAVAEADGHLIGFAHASMKLLPEHLGAARVGHISFVHVLPEYRRSGVARRLVGSLDEWMRARQVTSVELQVITGNEGAIAFWRALGFVPELLQMRRS